MHIKQYAVNPNKKGHNVPFKNQYVERGMPVSTSSHSAAGSLMGHSVEIKSFNETFNEVKLV